MSNPNFATTAIEAADEKLVLSYNEEESTIYLNDSVPLAVFNTSDDFPCATDDEENEQFDAMINRYGQLFAAAPAMRAALERISAMGCRTRYAGYPIGWTCLDDEAHAKDLSNSYSDEYRARLLAGAERCLSCVATAAIAASTSTESK